MNNLDRIIELREILTSARDSYYNEAISLMPDFEFDTLEDELRLLSPKDQYFKNIGAKVSKVSEWKKATHKISMTSLNKVNTIEEFKKWCSDVNINNVNTDQVSIQDKLDGSSIGLEYIDGKLVKAITRGDGTIGEDIVVNVLKMKNVKSQIDNFSGSLRGETFLLADDFEIINSILIKEGSKPLSNPRNGATGIAKRYDGRFSEYLTIYYYDISSDKILFKSEHGKLEYIKDRLGLQTCFFKLVSVEEAIKIYEDYEDHLRKETNYDIDGLVCKINDIEKQKELGNLGENPKGQIAWKFESVKAETEILDIEWSLGNRRLTPVGIFKETLIGGVKISRASLHNFEMFKNLKIGKNDRVLISRRNDVIPGLEKVLESKGNYFQPPTHCHVCKSELEVDNKFLVCPNDNCEGLAIRNLEKWIEKLEIMDVGGSTITALYKAGKIKEPADFYKLSISDIASLSGLGEKSAIKMLKRLNDKKEISLPTFISALNMTSFSTSTAESLMENGFDTIVKIFNAQENELIQIKGIEVKTASQIIKGIHSKADIIKNLFDVGIQIKEPVKVEQKGNALVGMSFCFTGKIEKIKPSGERYTRDMMHQLVKENGGKVEDGVNKDLTYLCQADPNSVSSKSKKAKQLGVTILSEADFFKMLGM